MAEDILEQDQASPFEAADPYLEAVEQRIREATDRLSYAHHMLDAVDEALDLTRCSRDELRVREDVEGRIARRVDKLRDQLAKAASGLEGAALRAAPMSVRELANAIGQSEHTTRRLLDAHLIPGARRKTPNVKNSPWLIPATAPAAYVAVHNGKEK